MTLTHCLSPLRGSCLAVDTEHHPPARLHHDKLLQQQLSTGETLPPWGYTKKGFQNGVSRFQSVSRGGFPRAADLQSDLHDGLSDDIVGEVSAGGAGQRKAVEGRVHAPCFAALGLHHKDLHIVMVRRQALRSCKQSEKISLARHPASQASRAIRHATSCSGNSLSWG